MIPATSIADPHQAVLVIVDIQERLAAAMDQRETVLESVGLLVSAARIMNVPVVVTRQYPKGLGDLEPALAEALAACEEEDAVLRRADKVTFDCFGEPSFTESVCGLGRRQLVIAGMETHICVTQTALTALREGFDVHVVGDACCSRHERSHTAALSRLSCAGAVVTTAESVAYELVGRAGTPEFKRLLAAVKG